MVGSNGVDSEESFSEFSFWRRSACKGAIRTVIFIPFICLTITESVICLNIVAYTAGSRYGKS